MAFQPQIKLTINRWRNSQDTEAIYNEIVIDNQISVDVSFTESVAPLKNNFRVTLYNFARLKNLNLTEGRDRVKVEMGYKDEKDIFCYEGVVSKLSYNLKEAEKTCSFDLVDGDDILDYPVSINEKAGKNRDGTPEKDISIYAILVRALPKIQKLINKDLKKNNSPQLTLQEHLGGRQGDLAKFDPQGVLKIIAGPYFQSTGKFRDVLNHLLIGSGFGYYIYNNGLSRQLRFFNKGQYDQNKTQYLVYTLTKDSGLLRAEVKVREDGVFFQFKSLFLPFLRAGSVIKIDSNYYVVVNLKVSGNNYRDGLVCEFMAVEL